MRDSTPNGSSTDLQGEPPQNWEDLLLSQEIVVHRMANIKRISRFLSSLRQSLYICTQFVARSAGRTKQIGPRLT